MLHLKVFSARCIHRTKRCVIAMMSVRLPTCLGCACIVIIRYTLVQISFYAWIVQCSGHPDTKACPPAPNRLFTLPPGREVLYAN